MFSEQCAPAFAATCFRVGRGHWTFTNRARFSQTGRGAQGLKGHLGVPKGMVLVCPPSAGSPQTSLFPPPAGGAVPEHNLSSGLICWQPLVRAGGQHGLVGPGH